MGDKISAVIEQAGVDTWSVCWYVDDETCATLRELATARSARSALLPESIEGHRVGWFPDARMLYAEGHPSPDGLANADELPGAFDRLRESLQDRGILTQRRNVMARQAVRPGEVGFGGVRRLDSTVDLRFENPVEGLAALSGVAALSLPRSKKKIVQEAGGRRVETVYFLGYGGRRVLGRWYDKGIERGEGERGAWVRPEDQRRYVSGSRLPLEFVASSTFVRDAFVKRFEPLWRAAKGVKVGGVLELAKRLGELQDEGLITPAEAKRIAGHLVLDAAGCHRQARSTVYGDRRAARDHGLVLADGVLDEVEVDLGDVLEEALDSAAWGAQG